MTAIAVIALLAFFVFFVLWAIALIKKNGKAKKMFLFGLATFIIFIIGISVADTQKPTETNSKPVATTPVKEKEVTTESAQQEQTDAKKPLIDTSLPFDKFSSTLFGMPVSKQGETFDSVRNQVVKWSGVVIEAGSSSLYVYGKPADYNGESWSDISAEKKKLGDVVIVKVSDRSELNGLNQGDIVSFSGELGSRGVKGESNWKLYNGKIEGRTVAEPQNSGTITKAKYNKIKNGMTYEEVAKIIGGPGEALSEVGEKGDKYYTVMYSYKGEGGLGANANFTFQGNKLQAKAQFGLE
ncbi:DUF3862 domain-containing protein [Paenibacillus polymyxa]|jgi:hypothetical protein|uniref:DUF3862 domain-containing protein n=1 Tax=Paenibacillus polymyxa TaxID=1406 RepID=UPI0020C5BB7B|nr:DUF3862 domain-containing protein [Paenibacillus polymyxa]MBZ6441747.1 DUF3862 domain-containing protein [Paenibacillus polymyxa]